MKKLSNATGLPAGPRPPAAPISRLASARPEGHGHGPPTLPDRNRLPGLALLGGCGGKSKPATTVVRGQILYRGEPVSGGLVVFAPNPDRGSDGPLLIVSLQEDGSFTLTAPDGKPVPPGWYRIAVAPKAGTVSVADGRAAVPRAAGPSTATRPCRDSNARSRRGRTTVIALGPGGLVSRLARTIRFRTSARAVRPLTPPPAARDNPFSRLPPLPPAEATSHAPVPSACSRPSLLGSGPAPVAVRPGQAGVVASKGTPRRSIRSAFNKDGTLAVTGAFDKSVRLWDPATGKQLREFSGPNGHQSLVLSVAFNPAGDQIASGGSDNTARVWDVPLSKPGPRAGPRGGRDGRRRHARTASRSPGPRRTGA